MTFESKDAKNPAKFYFNSTTAHRNYPDKKVTKADAVVAHMGSLEGSNDRNINKMIVNQVLPTCQLQMGMTELLPGSVWNTMPAHVHSRRMEAYFYFEVPEEHAVCHLMGEVEETRHIWMKGDQAIVAARRWSIHLAAEKLNYTFIWGDGRREPRLRRDAAGFRPQSDYRCKNCGNPEPSRNFRNEKIKN